MPRLPDPVWLAVAALGRSLNLDLSAFDEAGELELDIGQDLRVQLLAEHERGSLLLLGAAGALPLPAEAPRLVMLMQANFGWQETTGATLSLDGESPPQVVLARRLDWARLDDEPLLDAFEDFRTLLLDLHGWLDRPLDSSSAGLFFSENDLV